MSRPRLQVTAVVCLLGLAGTLTAPAARAQDVIHTTLFDLSADDAAAREIAFDVSRALRKSKQVRFRDLDESLNVGGEEMQVSSVKSGDGLVKSGRARLDKKEFVDAADDFDNAVASYLTAYAHLVDLTVVPRALALHGAALLLGGEAKAGAAAMLRAVQADPKAEIDLAEFPAKVQQVFDDAKKKAAGLSKVDFEVVSTPPNAKVYVNGRYAGLTPTYVNSVAGEQFIALGKQGWTRKALVQSVTQPGQQVVATLEPARRKPVYDGSRERLLEIFDGAVEGDDLTQAQGLCSTPYAVALRASGSREKMKVELALANLSSRQVVQRVVRELPWMKRDRDAIDKMVEDLLKPPEVKIETGVQKVETKSILKTWWFWTILGAIGVGSAVAYKLATAEPPVTPKYPPGHGGLLIEF